MKTRRNSEIVRSGLGRAADTHTHSREVGKINTVKNEYKAKALWYVKQLFHMFRWKWDNLINEQSSMYRSGKRHDLFPATQEHGHPVEAGGTLTDYCEEILFSSIRYTTDETGARHDNPRWIGILKHGVQLVKLNADELARQYFVELDAINACIDDHVRCINEGIQKVKSTFKAGAGAGRTNLMSYCDIPAMIRHDFEMGLPARYSDLESRLRTKLLGADVRCTRVLAHTLRLSEAYFVNDEWLRVLQSGIIDAQRPLQGLEVEPPVTDPEPDLYAWQGRDIFGIPVDDSVTTTVGAELDRTDSNVVGYFQGTDPMGWNTTQSVEQMEFQDDLVLQPIDEDREEYKEFDADVGSLDLNPQGYERE